jgi:hypothetical protein
MFGLRFVSLCVAAILCGSTNVAAAPAPKHQPGEIVHVNPSHTNGGSVGTGIDTAHPHIVLGHYPSGHVIVAPVTHNVKSDHLKPMMPPPNGDHGLTGGVRLDETYTEPKHITPSHGALAGKHVSQAGVKDIQNAKLLVNAHRNAAVQHTGAAQAHRNHQAFHDSQSSHHFQTGNAAAGMHHAGQASVHGGHAGNHETAAANHHAAANNVHGPNAQELANANRSAGHVNNVHRSFAEAAYHDQAAHQHSQTGNHMAAYQSGQAANAARHAANQHSASSITAHNAATGHHR